MCYAAQSRSHAVSSVAIAQCAALFVFSGCRIAGDSAPPQPRAAMWQGLNEAMRGAVSVSCAVALCGARL